MSYLPELRASLVRAAERQAHEAPAPRGSRGWFGVAAAVTVAVAVVALAIVLVGHGRGGGQSPPVSHGAPTPPTLPHFAAGEFTAIKFAQKATATQDHACAAQITSLPQARLTAPMPALVAALGALRRAPSAADALPKPVLRAGVAADALLRAVRLVHRAGNVAVYLVPLTNLHALRLVPARCDAEQAKALRQAMRAASRARVNHALKDQAAYLAWQRYHALHPTDMCLATVRVPAKKHPIVAAWQCGWSLAELNQGVAGLGEISGLEFRGIVPDGVARVSARFALDGGGYRTVTTSVRDNLFVAEAPRHSRFPPVTLTWWSSAGRQIKTIHLR